MRYLQLYTFKRYIEFDRLARFDVEGGIGFGSRGIAEETAEDLQCVNAVGTLFLPTVEPDIGVVDLGIDFPRQTGLFGLVGYAHLLIFQQYGAFFIKEGFGIVKQSCFKFYIGGDTQVLIISPAA